MEGVKSVIKYKDLSFKSWIKEGIFNKYKIKNLQIGEFIEKHKSTFIIGELNMSLSVIEEKLT